MPERKKKRDEISFKGRAIGKLAATLIRCLCMTYRWEVVDNSGVLNDGFPDGSLIWTFWHNRVLALPGTYKRYFHSRSGAVLTSASKDGEIIAATMEEFGISAVRGSSSRRGASALLALVDWIKRGYDVVITPDGPRGPRYRLAPGIIKLAQVTGAGILPIRAEAASVWRFDTWDKFQVPKPFTRIRLILEPIQSIDPELADKEEFESERIRIESILNPNNETD